MRNGNSLEDAFKISEEILNASLEEESLNSPVVAIAPGVVTKVGYDSRSGFQVTIEHFVSGEETKENIQTLKEI